MTNDKSEPKDYKKPDNDRLKVPRFTSVWGGIENAPFALDEAALKAAKDAMVEATGLSPMWGSAAAWAGARAAVTAYLAAISEAKKRRPTND